MEYNKKAYGETKTLMPDKHGQEAREALAAYKLFMFKGVCSDWYYPC